MLRYAMPLEQRCRSPPAPAALQAGGRERALTAAGPASSLTIAYCAELVSWNSSTSTCLQGGQGQDQAGQAALTRDCTVSGRARRGRRAERAHAVGKVPAAAAPPSLRRPARTVAAVVLYSPARPSRPPEPVAHSLQHQGHVAQQR